jgi:hypothetical protein
MATTHPLELSRPESNPRPYPRPWYIDRINVASAVLLFVLTTTLVAAAAVSKVLRGVAPPANLFAHYEALYPGQPMKALESFPCHMVPHPQDYLSHPKTLACQFVPDNGPFTSITVYGAGETIRGVLFQVEALRVGDIIEIWGTPDQTNRYQHFYSMRWDSTIYTTGRTSGHVTLWSEVRQVLFMSPYGPA